MSAKDIYAQQVQKSREEAEHFRLKARWFPWLRAGFFLASVVVAVRVWAGELASSWMWASGGLFVAFLLAAVRHHHLQRAREDAELMEQVNQRAQQRCTDQWHDFEPRGDDFATLDHPYGHDLDIFGQGSLFQMINTTTTWFGLQTLARWLLERAEPEELELRQQRIADLKDRLDLRQSLEREGLRIQADPQNANPEAFLQWAEGAPQILEQRWLFGLAVVLPPWVVGAMFYWMAKVLPPWLAGVENPAAFAPYSAWWWFLPWLVLLGLFLVYVGPCQRIFREVIFHERAFSLYRALFARIEAEEAQGTPFAELQQQLKRAGYPPHEEIRRLQRWIDLVEVRQSPILHLPLNLLLLWDIHCLFGMERWKRRVGHHVRGWFAQIGELEALSCLAGVAHDNPSYSFPEFAEQGALLFEAQGLGHPLLPGDKRVSNDVSLHPERPLMVITGSNMSGKSTMLRAIGLNAVLAFAGSVVCAKSLKLSMMQVGTSMRIADSLEQGVSYFMAELQRIHRIVSLRHDEDGAPQPLLFLLDEILHGTNTRERRIAALGIVTLLQEAHTLGCVTTHDLELAEECKRFGEKAQFTYFTDLIEGGQMVFDYQLREGICPTTNALKLMRLVGIPLPEAGEDDEKNPPDDLS